MEKLTILCLIIISSIQLTTGQEYSTLPVEKIRSGKLYNENKEKHKQYFNYSDGMLAVKSSGGRVTLQTYDTKNLSPIKVNSFRDFPDGFVYEETIDLNNRFFMFYSNWEATTQNYQLFVREIDLKNCSFFKGEKKVINHKGKISFSETPERTPVFTSRKFDFFVSKQKNMLLIKYLKITKAMTREAFVFLTVFDANLNLKWSKEVKHKPITDWTDFIIGSDGSIYSFPNNYALSGQYHFSFPTQINLTKYDANNNWSEETKTIQFRDNTKIQGRIIETKSHILFSGNYATNKKRKTDTFDKALNGVLHADLSDWSNNFRVNYYNIPIEVINENIGPKKLKENLRKEKNGKKIVGIPDLRPINIYELEDSSYLIVQEQRVNYMADGMTTLPSGGILVTGGKSFIKNDLVLTKLNKNGSLDWINKIPKRQQSKKLNSKIFQDNTNLYFIFKTISNSPKILALKGDNENYGYITLLTINKKTGNYKKLFLFGTINQFSIDRIIETTSGKFIFEVPKDKGEDILIEVDFQ